DEVHEVKLAEQHYSGLEGAKILLIENDPNGSDAMAALLEGWGCDVATTRSAADALLRLSELGGAPDAVIADLHLDHGESGLSAIADVREHLKLDTPAMIITADYSEKAPTPVTRTAKTRVTADPAGLARALSRWPRQPGSRSRSWPFRRWPWCD